MNQFIWDMIHLTEGEKLIKYWWLWLLMIAGVWLLYAAALAIYYWHRRRNR